MNINNDNQPDFQWSAPPEGVTPPDVGPPIERDKKAKLSLGQGTTSWNMMGESPETYLETLSEFLDSKPFQTRTNGTDFLFFVTKPKTGLASVFGHSMQGTYVLMTMTDGKWWRLSELSNEEQDQLHRGEGGYQVNLDFHIKRNPWGVAWIAIILPILLALVSGLFLRSILVAGSVLLGAFTLLVCLDYFLFKFKWLAPLKKKIT